MKPVYFEDLLVGATRETLGRTITETDVVLHAGHTGDFYPHHVDEEFARTTVFGKRIAHGTMTFAIAVGLTAMEANPESFTYGYDRVRFPRPVFIGDTIRVRLTIADASEDPKRADYGRCVEKLETTNQRGEVVLACEHIILVKRKPVMTET
jgi:acyl dehydratase